MLNIINGVCLGRLQTIIKVKVFSHNPLENDSLLWREPIQQTPPVGEQHVSTARGLIVGEKEQEEITEKQKRQLCV